MLRRWHGSPHVPESELRDAPDHLPLRVRTPGGAQRDLVKRAIDEGLRMGNRGGTIAAACRATVGRIGQDLELRHGRSAGGLNQTARPPRASRRRR